MYRLLITAALLLAPFVLQAQGKNISSAPVPAWLAPYQPDLSRKVSTKDFSDGYYQLLFEEQHHVDRKTVYRHIIRQIDSEAGIQNGSEINVDYSPEYEKIQFHQIQVRRNGQVINQLNLSKIKVLQQEQDLSMFIYSGRYNAYYIVEDVRKGDQIEYAYSIIGENPIFNGLYSTTFFLASYEPVANYYKALIASPARPLQFRYYDNAPRPVEKDLAGGRLYEWDLANKVTVLKPEDYQPSWYTGFPTIDVSEFAGWAAVAQWGAAVNNIPLSGNAVAERIALLKKQAGGDTARYMEAAIRFVQDDIRYMGIEMGEYSHRPNTPEKVCRQRFGDCKDKALLLTALLRAQGIEADLAYVHTDLREHIAARLPAPERFNHAIVKARFRNRDFWIDATIAYQRGTLSTRYNPNYKKALVARAGMTGLTDIVENTNGNIHITENFEIPSIENTTAELRVESIYTGVHADEMRSTLANSALSEIEDSYTGFYGKKFGKVSMTDSMEISDDETLNHITIKERYTIEEPWTIDSTKNLMQSFSTPAHVITTKVLGIDKNRETPLALEFPLKMQHQINITFPQDWQLTPESVDLNRAAYRFTAKSSIFQNKVQLRYSFESKKDHIPENDLRQYQLDMDELSRSANYTFSWTPGAADLAAKRGTAGGINWPLILTALAAGAVFGWLCLRYNKRSLPSSFPARQPWDFGSWLILIVIGVVFSPVRVTLALFQTESFDLGVWNNINVSYAGHHAQLVKGLLTMEVIANMFILALTIFNVVLLFRKRDIFPRVFCFLLAFNVLWCVVDFGLAGWLFNTNLFAENARTMLTTLGAAALWIPVMLRSQRAKETFVVPYEEA